MGKPDKKTFGIKKHWAQGKWILTRAKNRYSRRIKPVKTKKRRVLKKSANLGKPSKRKSEKIQGVNLVSGLKKGFLKRGWLEPQKIRGKYSETERNLDGFLQKKKNYRVRGVNRAKKT